MTEGTGGANTKITNTDPALRAIQIGLERVGWAIVSAEIDLSRETARIELKRQDGRYVTFDARCGRSTLTREHMERRDVFVAQVRGGYFAERITMTFLGRTAHEGARSGLRALCSYLAANSTRALSALGARRLFALVMDGRHHALGSPDATRHAAGLACASAIDLAARGTAARGAPQ